MKLGQMNKGQTVERLILAIIPVIMFVLLCIYDSTAIKIAAFVFMLVVLTLMVLSFTKLKKYIHIRDRFGIVFLGATAMVLMDGISTLYAASGKITLYTFAQVAAAFCLTVIVVALVPGERSEAGTRIARVLSVASAIAAVVSIDLISTQLLVQPILVLVGQAGAYMNGALNSRLESVFRNANVFAGITGIGTMLSLGHAADKTCPKDKFKYNSVLFINSLAFLLTVSRGAIASIGVAFIVLLIVTGKEKRGRMLVLMVETLICALGGAAVIATTSFGDWERINLIPLAVLALGAVVQSVLDICIGDRIFAKLNPKKAMIVLIVIALMVAIGGVLVFSINGELTLPAGVWISRSAYLDAGEYTLEIDTSNPSIRVSISCRNYQQAMMGTSVWPYSGSASEAHFSVPEGSIATYLYFISDEADGVVHSAVLVSDAGRESVHLDYKLLPDFIENRLQGLRASTSFIQRLMLFSDGLKLTAQRPIFGHGMGGFQNGLKSVQSFDYTTKYVHNHYIESLVDTGIVGLCLFVGTLSLGFIASFRARKKHPLAPALFACLVFMAIHAGVEVVFSSYYYLPFAFGAFALIDLCCTEQQKPEIKLANTAVLMLLASLCSILLGRNIVAQASVKANPTLDNVTNAIELDYYEKVDHITSYIMYSFMTDDAAVQKQAAAYAEELRKDDNPDAYTTLIEYYFASGDVKRGFEIVERFVNYSASNPDDWTSAFELLEDFFNMQYYEDEAFIAGVGRIYEMFLARDEVSLDNLKLADHCIAFLQRAGVIKPEPVAE